VLPRVAQDLRPDPARPATLLLLPPVAAAAAHQAARTGIAA
jgi:phage tail sheath gpL-like